MTTQTVQESAEAISSRARQAIREVQEGTEKRVKKLLDRGEESLSAIRDRFDPAVKLSEDIVRRARTNAEWLQDKIEAGVTRTLETLNIPTRSELQEVQASLVRLRQKTNTLDRKIRKVREEIKASTPGSTPSRSRRRTSRSTTKTAASKARQPAATKSAKTQS